MSAANKQIEEFFEHPEEKVRNSNLNVGRASPEKLCLGLEVKRSLPGVGGWGFPRQMRMWYGNIKLEKASTFIHSAFPTIKTNLDRTMSRIFLKIKISRKGSHFEFALCFLGKNLAVKLKIMVVGLSNILQSAFLLSPQPSSLKVTSPTSRISSFLWVSGSPEFSQRAAYTSREEETFGCQVASFRSSLGT